MTTHTISLKDEKARLSPEWLREKASSPDAVILIMQPHLSTLADALEIADSCARSDIESFCGWEGEADVRWYDTTEDAISPADDYSKKTVAQAVRYLDARGALERHATNARLVRLLGTSE